MYDLLSDRLMNLNIIKGEIKENIGRICGNRDSLVLLAAWGGLEQGYFSKSGIDYKPQIPISCGTDYSADIFAKGENYTVGVLAEVIRKGSLADKVSGLRSKGLVPSSLFFSEKDDFSLLVASDISDGDKYDIAKIVDNAWYDTIKRNGGEPYNLGFTKENIVEIYK